MRHLQLQCKLLLFLFLLVAPSGLKAKQDDDHSVKHDSTIRKASLKEDNFVGRFENGFKPLFFIEILVNWFIPFAVLLPTRTSRSKIVITLVILCLIPGQYIDLFNQIMPGTLGELKFGLIEVGAFLGYAGLFAGVIGYTLTRAPLISRNHPFLEESLEHQF